MDTLTAKLDTAVTLAVLMLSRLQPQTTAGSSMRRIMETMAVVQEVLVP